MDEVIDAIETGDLSEVKQLITSELLQQLKDGLYGKDIIHAAAKSGNVDLFEYLTSLGFDPNDADSFNESLLYSACEGGKLQMVKFLITTYPHMNRKKHSESLLHLVAKSGNVQLFKYLVTLGFDPRTENNLGQNILYIACEACKIEMVKFLDRTYPDMKRKRDKRNRTVLHAAAVGDSVDIFKFLVGEGMDPDALTSSEETVLHLACSSRSQEPLQRYSLIKHIIDSYPSMKSKVDKEGFSALHGAAGSGNVDIFRVLVGHGMDVYNESKSGINVLMTACRGNKICTFDACQMVRCIAEDHPDLLQKTDSEGNTALHYAASGRSDVSVQIVKFLTEKDLDVYASGKNNQTVLHAAFENGSDDVVKYLFTEYPKFIDILKSDNGKPIILAGRKLIDRLIDSLSGEGESRARQTLGKAFTKEKAQKYLSYRTQFGDEEMHIKRARGVFVIEERHEHLHRWIRESDFEGDVVSDQSSHIASISPSQSMLLLVENKIQKPGPSFVDEDLSSLEASEDFKSCVSELSESEAELDKTIIKFEATKKKRNDIQELRKEVEELKATTSKKSKKNREPMKGQDKPIKCTDILSPKRIRRSITDTGKESIETDSLLQWLCARAEMRLTGSQKISVAYDPKEPSEPVLLAFVEDDTCKMTDISIDSFKLIVREKDSVSMEAKDIAALEIRQKLQYSVEEKIYVRETLAKHSKRLMDKHSNLQIISASKLKSRRYGTEGAITEEKTCIVFYVSVKGLVPFREELFPEFLDDLPVDVREGHFYPYTDPQQYHEHLMMGCQIASSFGNCGSLGGFVELKNGTIYGLSCWHVFASEKREIDIGREEVFQPDTSNLDFKIGHLSKVARDTGGKDSIGLDAALIDLTETHRKPINGRFPDATSEIAGFSEEKPMEFTSGRVVQSFEEVLRTSNIVKYGPKTGHTVGMLRLAGTSVQQTQFTYFTDQRKTYKHELHQQFEVFEVDGKTFSNFGDSGSLVFIVSDQGSDYDICALGILVGGTDYGTTIVTPIWAILERFNLPMKLLSFGNDKRAAATTIEKDVSHLKKNVATLQTQMSNLESTVKSNSASTNLKLDKMEASTNMTNEKLDKVLNAVMSQGEKSSASSSK